MAGFEMGRTLSLGWIEQTTDDEEQAGRVCLSVHQAKKSEH